MERYPISASSLEKFFYIDGHLLERQYREHLSGYLEWEEQDHADKWLVFPENVGSNMSIDETALSDGELYTILTNKDAHGKKGSLAAIVAGTKAEVVREALDHNYLSEAGTCSSNRQRNGHHHRMCERRYSLRSMLIWRKRTGLRTN